MAKFQDALDGAVQCSKDSKLITWVIYARNPYGDYRWMWTELESILKFEGVSVVLEIHPDGSVVPYQKKG